MFQRKRSSNASGGSSTLGLLGAWFPYPVRVLLEACTKRAQTRVKRIANCWGAY